MEEDFNSIEFLNEGWTYTWNKKTVPYSYCSWESGAAKECEKTQYDFETAGLSLLDSSSYTAGWERTNAAAYEGSWSLRSTDIDDNESAKIDLDLSSFPKPGEIIFYYKCDSETYDKIKVKRDSTTVASGLHSTTWKSKTLSYSSSHSKFTFIYDKDTNISNGADTCYIDNLKVKWT